MLDRFDINIDIAELPTFLLVLSLISESTETVYQRIIVARYFGAIRHEGMESWINSRLFTDQINKNMMLTVEIKDLLRVSITN